MGSTAYRGKAIRYGREPACGVRLRATRQTASALLAAALAALPLAVDAQLYKWTDENGKVQYSDTVPPSANDRARKELRSDGTVIRDTGRAMTAEEKRIAAQKAAEAAKAQELQTERERKDKALLGTYTDLRDFDRVRDRSLGVLDAEISALVARETSLNSLLTANAPAPAGAPGSKASEAAKSANAQTQAARADLPVLREHLAAKRRDRADIAAMYASERARLATLLDAERKTMPPGATAPTQVSPATRR